MKDFLGQELLPGDKVAYITGDKTSLKLGVVYSVGEKNRLHVYGGTSSYEDIAKAERKYVSLDFKWNTQVIKL